jgi:hypothetical protein
VGHDDSVAVVVHQVGGGEVTPPAAARGEEVVGLVDDQPTADVSLPSYVGGNGVVPA